MKNLILNTIIFLLSSYTVIAQNIVTGTITDTEGITLPGVNVLEKGTANGMISDLDGKFSIEISENGILVFSFMGFETQELVVGSQETLQVTMVVDNEALDEVVVIGYGEVKRSEITNAISTVKGEEIAKITASNAAEALQGRATGVQVISAGGGPGASPRILVRGVISNGGTNPLIVVDGVLLPLNSSLNFLNPADIQDFQILKDASATAIYGARASNGVLLITTKRGKEGKTVISADVSHGFQQLEKFELAGADEYIKVYNQRRLNDVQDPVDVQDQLYDPADFSADTDWWEETIEDLAPITNINVRASGGSEKLKYAASVSYFDQESNFSKGWYERVTGRFNIDFKLSDKVSLQQDFSPRLVTSEATPIGSTFNILRIDPLTEVFLPQEERVGRDEFSTYSASNNLVPNPVGSIHRIFNQTNFFGFFSNTKLNYDISPSFTVSSQLGVNISTQRRDRFFPQFFTSVTEQRQTNSVRRDVRERFDYVINNTINYKTQIDKHSINLLGGVLYDSQRFNRVQGERDGVPDNENPNLRYLNTAFGERIEVVGTEAVDNILSGIFRGIYNYDNRYFLTSSVRVDQSSRFPRDSQTGIFSSASFAWDIDSEPFFKSKFINNLRVNMGVGEVGNQNINRESQFSTINNGNFPLGGQGTSPPTTAFLERIGNPELKWETVRDLNLGITGAILDNSLSFTLEYYKKTSTDLLFDVELTNFSGIATDVGRNVGSFQSEGFDIQLGYIKKWGDFSLDANFNISTNRSIAKELAPGNERLFAQNRPNLGGRRIKITEEGERIGLLQGFRTSGIFQNQTEINAHAAEDGTLIQPSAQPGDLRFVDNNNDGVLDEDDMTTIGDPFPDFFGGLTLNLGYKGFDLSSQWYGTYGNEIFNYQNLFLNSAVQDVNVAAGALGRVWTPQNPGAQFPRLSVLDRNGNYARPSDIFIEDGSYLRLRNLQVGYTFTPKFVQKFRVYISGQNLWTITNYSGFDPEVQSPDNNDTNIITNLGVDLGRLPITTTYLVGLNITL